MPYTVDRTEQLENALTRNRFGSVASLRAAGTTARQHNVGVKKSVAKKSAKKTVAKKVSAKSIKKTAVKKTAAKKATPTKKS